MVKRAAGRGQKLNLGYRFITIQHEIDETESFSEGLNCSLYVLPVVYRRVQPLLRWRLSARETERTPRFLGMLAAPTCRPLYAVLLREDE